MSVSGSRPIICVITRGEATDLNFQTESGRIFENIRVAIDEKVRLVQIREKQLSARSLFQLTAAAARLAAGTQTLVLVNDRFDIALAAGAAGVHLTERSIPVGVLRRHVPSGFVLGVSTHSAVDTVAARDGGADYAIYGPVFVTPGKGEPHGVEDLRAVCGLVDGFDVLGIGGIDESNVETVLSAGAAGFAGIRAFNDADRLGRISRQLNR